MTTPTPLEQQRQWLSEFQAEEIVRAEREARAKQEYGLGEKASNEKYAATERAAVQQYAAVEKVAEQKYAEAIKQIDTQLAEQQAAINSVVQRIEESWEATSTHLVALGIQSSLLPSLQNVGVRTPDAVVYGDAVAELSVAAEQLENLEEVADHLYQNARIWKQVRRSIAIAAVIAVVALAIGGYNFYQSWSHEQVLAGFYDPGVAALNAQDWQTARDELGELLRLQPGYRDAEDLFYQSYYRPAVAALDAQDWQRARDEFNELLQLQPDYRSAQQLFLESYYRPAVAALDEQNWQKARDEFNALLLLQPDYKNARLLLDLSIYRQTEKAIENKDWNSVRQVLGVWTPSTYGSFGSYFDSWTESLRENISPIVNLRDKAQYVLVPAGEFLMGSTDEESGENERPQHKVYLDSYWIMQTEVTNAQYALCVAAGACTAPNNANWQKQSAADHPVTNVTWNQAQAYAQWAGGRLPTEAEWEKAARGTDGRTFPWGNQPVTARLVNCCDFMGGVTFVSVYGNGASPYGSWNMSGNVREWTADGYDAGYYSVSPERNPQGPSDSRFRVWRGGSFLDDSDLVRTASRRSTEPTTENSSLGFRVVALGFQY